MGAAASPLLRPPLRPGAPQIADWVARVTVYHRAVDSLSYTLIVGTFVLPTFILVKVAERVMVWVFEGQSILISLPIP